MPGIVIPDEVRKRIATAADARAEGVSIAVDLFTEIRERVAGMYLIPPFKRYDLAADLVERVRAR